MRLVTFQRAGYLALVTAIGPGLDGGEGDFLLLSFGNVKTNYHLPPEEPTLS